MLLRREATATLVAAALTATVSCQGEPTRRVEAIYDLAATASPESAEKIRGYLDDPDRDVRATAVFQLAGLDPDGAKEAVVAALADADGFVRATAVRCAADYGDPSLVPRLAGLLADDPDWHVRRRAADALAAIGGGAAAGALLVGLDDPVKEVRLASVKAAASVDPVPAVPRLVVLVVEDPEWEVRVHSAGALGKAGLEAGLEPLATAMQDENEFVRAAATRARAEVERAVSDRPPSPKEGTSREASG